MMGKKRTIWLGLVVFIIISFAGCVSFSDAVDTDEPAGIIKDSNLEQAIREEINKPTGELTEADVADISFWTLVEWE